MFLCKKDMDKTRWHRQMDRQTDKVISIYPQFLFSRSIPVIKRQKLKCKRAKIFIKIMELELPVIMHIYILCLFPYKVWRYSVQWFKRSCTYTNTGPNDILADWLMTFIWWTRPDFTDSQTDRWTRWFLYTYQTLFAGSMTKGLKHINVQKSQNFH